MIRRLLVLAGLAGLAVVARRLLRHRTPVERVSIGFADGSSVTLEPGAPGLDTLLEAARGALLP